MRTKSVYYKSEIMPLLEALSNKSTQVAEYRSAFKAIGNYLGKVLKMGFNIQKNKTILACASEDADWLAQGVLDELIEKEPAVAVFWNERYVISSNTPVASIVKSYIEPISTCETLIIVKSIINTSCVVKTQLLRLISIVEPSQIIIVSPVFFVNAENNLRAEFPEAVSEKFKFVYLVEDSEVTVDGEVLPGIGGMVYPRLGLGDGSGKNRYIPRLVKTRRKMIS